LHEAGFITDVIIFKRCGAFELFLQLNNPVGRSSAVPLTSNLELTTAWKKIKRFSGNRPFPRIPILKQQNFRRYQRPAQS